MVVSIFFSIIPIYPLYNYIIPFKNISPLRGLWILLWRLPEGTVPFSEVHARLRRSSGWGAHGRKPSVGILVFQGQLLRPCGLTSTRPPSRESRSSLHNSGTFYGATGSQVLNMFEVEGTKAPSARKAVKGEFLKMRFV